jgi:hypothetical protein
MRRSKKHTKFLKIRRNFIVSQAPITQHGQFISNAPKLKSKYCSFVPPSKPPSLTIPVTIHINCTNFTDPKNNNSSPDPATTDDELLDMHESDSDAGTAGDSDGDASIQQKERDRSSRQQKRRENIRRYVPSLLILLLLGLFAILYRRYQLNKKGGTKLSSRPTPPPPKKDFHTAPTWVVKTGREQEDDNQSTVAASVWSMSAGNRPEEEEEKNKDWLSV